MRTFAVALSCLFSATAYAQRCVHISVRDMSGTADSIFVAGDFNDWNPRNPKYLMTKKGADIWELTMLVPAGPQAYKFTRGSWEIAEADSSGAAAQNRILAADTQIIFHETVPRWTSNAVIARKHTASANVHILDTSFYIPALNRHRRIWIYLPATYDQTGSTERYPVLYMHDGQNLFDYFTAPNGEWGVDEALDSLQPQTGKYCIVVGIDHGGEKRMTEYDPYDNPKYGKAEGDAYANFIANTLKPFIDAHYRTKPGAPFTAIAGSSMGGLISTYAVLKYPDVFGSAGIFSPSLWIAPSLKTWADTAAVKNPNLRFWFYAGEKESLHMIPDMAAMKEVFLTKYQTDIAFTTDPGGSHNEGAWRKWFPDFYRWWVKKL